MILESVGAIAGRAALALRGRPAKALILLYHRLGHASVDPWSLGVSPERFAQQMRVVAKRFRPMSLVELHDKIQRRVLPSRAIAVTFDDGYAAHLDEMTSVATRFGVPLTSYVCTGPMVDSREFWWDELARVLLESPTLPKTLRLPLDGTEMVRELGEDAECNSERVTQHISWRVWDPPPSARATLYKELYDLLFSLDATTRASTLDALMEWSGLPREPRASHRVISAAELRELAGTPGVDIGAHTVSHSPLVTLSRREQQQEIVESKCAIETITNRPVTTFAYPFGRRADYDDSTIELLRSEGFTSACANIPAPAQEGAPAYELPRVQIQDWSPEHFAQRLSKWLLA
ncbi:MAG TPA: polysaccharide deacetylase family protein [Gemmatimonadaceae bacterium]|nr:polysaccharide deacetylase family protein [Gemmatimonadaceae bacterium]